ncbi:hypothetical protein D3C76_1157050 [compost metagenome]
MILGEEGRQHDEATHQPQHQGPEEGAGEARHHQLEPVQMTHPHQHGGQHPDEGNEAGDEHGPEAVFFQQTGRLGQAAIGDHLLHLLHETGALQRPPLQIGDQTAAPGRQRQIEQRHFQADHPEPDQATGQQHHAVAGQRQEDETRFEKEDHHQAGDEQTHGLHMNKLFKILMPYGMQHVLHLV